MVRGWKECVILSILFLVPIVFYSQTLTFDFVSFDDGLHIYQNPKLNPPSWSGVKEFWTRPYQGLYVPITYTVWSLEAAFAKRKPIGHQGRSSLSPILFHFGNLFLHGANGAIFYVLLRTLSFSIGGSAVAVLFFLFHPLQVEAVAWISSLKDLLAGFFALLSLLQYLLFRKEKTKKWHYFLSALCFVCALLSKPSALIVPLIAGVLDRACLGRNWKESWRYWVPGFFIGAPLVFLTKWLQPDQSLDFIPSFFQRLVVALDTLCFYLGKLFFPFLLTLNYGRTPEHVLSEPTTVLLLAVPLVIGYFVWKHPNWKIAWTALALFVIGPLPVLGFIPFYYQKYSTVADRYLYLAMLGPALFLAHWLSQRPRRWRFAFASVLLALLTARSLQQLHVWKNNRTMIHQVGLVNSNDPDVHYSLAVVFSEESQLPGQTSFYSEMLRLPVEERDEATRLSRQREAIFHYEEAIRLNPLHAFAHNNLGLVLHRMGNFVQAEGHFKKAVEIEPQMGQAFNNLGATLAREGKLQEAISAFEKAQALSPGDGNVQKNLRQTEGLLLKKGKG